MIGPAPVLAAIVGLFHVSAYVFIRGRAGARLPLLVVAAVLGAWAGDTVAARMAIDPIRIGEFHLVTASIVAWLGIGLVAILAVLVPERRERSAPARVTTSVTRSGNASAGTDARGAPDATTPDATTPNALARHARATGAAEPEPQGPR